MSTLRSIPAAALAAALLAGSSASAQMVPGLTFRIRTQLRNHPAPEKSRVDSVRLKRLAMEAAARSDDIMDTPVARPQGGGGANNVLTMNGFFIKGAGRFDVLGVIGNVELQATQSAIITDTS